MIKRNAVQQYHLVYRVKCFSSALSAFALAREIFQLRDDGRWDLAALLDAEQKEKMFVEHIEALSSKKKKSFRRLLDECEHITLTSTWKEIRKKIKHDSRFSKYSDDDHVR